FVCRSIFFIDDESGMLQGNLSSAYLFSLEPAVLDELSRKIAGRALEYTSARRIFKRLLRFTLICQVIHHRFDAFIFAFLEAKLSIKDDIAILGDIARSVGQVKVFCFD